MVADFLVIGGGVVGLSVALHLRRRWPDAEVLIIEKEQNFGMHASTRNSGVLHAGFYYSADSLKAKFTREGNLALRNFCKERGLRLNECGKLVVARGPNDLPGLEELLRRAHTNGVVVRKITHLEAKEIEPRVKTYHHALWSPNTATADPNEVMAALVRECEAKGVGLNPGIAYLRRVGHEIHTTDGVIEPAYVVNCAGVFADRIAHDFGFGREYRLLPFKGLYLHSEEPSGALRTNVYPVPDLRNPFLGVHFTVTAQGCTKIGPTAIPCFGREQYGWLRGVRAKEGVRIALDLLALFLRSESGLFALAWQEVRKYSRTHLVAQAARLVEGVRASDYRRWGIPGIRAQLVDVQKRALVNDFCLQGDDRSMHVLNAVSPAWTCAFPFANYVCERIGSVLGESTTEITLPAK